MILERLERAVRAARAAGADEVEISHGGELAGVTRFANSTFTQAGEVVDRLTRVRVAVDGGRVGAVVTSALDALEHLAEARLELRRRLGLRPID